MIMQERLFVTNGIEAGTSVFFLLLSLSFNYPRCQSRWIQGPREFSVDKLLPPRRVFTFPERSRNYGQGWLLSTPEFFFSLFFFRESLYF